MEASILYPDNDAMKVYEWNYKKSEAEQTDFVSPKGFGRVNASYQWIDFIKCGVYCQF